MKLHEQQGGEPDPLGLLASAIAGRPLQVAAGRPGARAWTDAHVVFVDADLGPRQRVEAVAVQASLLAADSLAPDVVKRLIRRPALARRYLAVEGHRALAGVADILPPALQSLIDFEMAARVDSPAASLATARRRRGIPDPPESFGAIRATRLLASRDGARRADTERPGAPHTHAEALSEPDEDGDGAGDGAADPFGSPDGSGGTLGRLLGKMLRAVRRITGGGSPGAETPTHRISRPLAPRGRAHLSVRAAGKVEANPFGERRTTLYPEWDAQRRRYRRDWCTVNEVDPRPKEGDPLAIPHRYGLRRPLARLGMGLDRYHRQTQGDDIDIDAAIEARVEALAGSAPDEAVHLASLRRRRDLAVLMLLDISGSAREPAATGETVHEQQRAVAAALAATLHEIGDRVALYAFHSQGRSSVSVLAVKRFDDDLDARAMQRLQSLVPGAYSRLGAAIRHGTAVLEERAGTPRRLLVVLSDGLAYDHGYEPAYGAADARRALAEARARGVGCLCLSIGANTETAALRRVFGSAAHATIPAPSRLGNAIGPLFRSAIRSAEARRRVA